MGELKNFEVNIGKTGFVHEHNVSSVLQYYNWTVIIDDVEGKVREIGIVAYKVTKRDYICYYTVLTISCKKNGENIWALISRDENP